MAERGIDISTLEYSGDFGRRLDYYTDFVFEIHHESSAHLGQVIGGGRYNKLVERLVRPIAFPLLALQSGWTALLREQADEL